MARGQLPQGIDFTKRLCDEIVLKITWDKEPLLRVTIKGYMERM